MKTVIISSALEAGLTSLWNAGRAGVPWWEAPDRVEAAMEEAGLDPADAAAYDALVASHLEGARERARRSLDERLAVWRESGCELEAHYAVDLIEDAARAADIGAEEIVEIVSEVCPLPEAALFLAEQALRDFRRIPAIWRAEIEKANAAAAEAASVEPKPTAQARIEVEAGPLSPEKRRAALGMPSGLLRTVDYDPVATHSAPTWLVKGLFPAQGLGMLVGESQAGKSFVGVHAAVCIARGEPFFGRKVKPGSVLYIAAEGGSSVIPRIKAADEAIGGMLSDSHLTRKGKPAMARAPITVMTETPNLSRDGDPAALARTLRALHRERAGSAYPLSFVVVDTWHAVLCGGDEQSAADAGHALKPLREAAEELGVFVLIIHHPGKDLDRGARGSSALRAAMDTEVELRVPGADGSKAKTAGLLRRATVTKQRDGSVGDELFCHLNTVVLGHDEDGDVWTTCTVSPCEAPAMGANGRLKGKHDGRLSRALEDSLVEHGGTRAPMKMVRGYFNNAGPADEKDDARRRGFRRAFDAACDAGHIETDSCEQWVWFSNSARDTGQPDTP